MGISHKDQINIFYMGVVNVLRFERDKLNTLANKTFGQLYEDTLTKEKEIKKEGFNLVTIWESDFDETFNFSYY
jgi:ubiquinone biosynthesis protein Coq4